MGQIKGVVYKGQIYDPGVKNSLNAPVEKAFDFLTGQVGIAGLELTNLKTGFGINKSEVKLKARAKIDFPGDRAKVKVDILIDGSADVNKKGYVKEFYADDARGSADIKLKNSGDREIFDIQIATFSPIKLVKEVLGGDFQAVIAKIDTGNSEFGPLL